MKDNRLNLKGRKVLVTGADGFIGSHLTEKLINLGCEVKALSYYNSFNYWGWLEDIRNIDSIEVLSGDIRDTEYIRKITKGVDIIFHLAALIAIPYSYHAPQSYVDTNIKGTLNVCLAAKENNCRLIHTSTSEVYGTAQYVPIDEQHPLQAQSPYSATKIGADALAMSFYHAYNLPVTIARPFNTYGPRQSARAVIPTIIAQALTTTNNQIKLGSLTPVRDMNYVADTVNGFISSAESLDSIGQVFNFGSGKGIDIGELARSIIRIINPKISILTDEKRIRPQKSEVMKLICNNRKARSVLNWQPEFSLNSGLQKTIEFVESHLNYYKPQIYNL